MNIIFAKNTLDNLSITYHTITLVDARSLIVVQKTKSTYLAQSASITDIGIQKTQKLIPTIISIK